MPENENLNDDERTITEVGRTLLKYLHRRFEELGTNQASYRQARMELLRLLEEGRKNKRFNWGFEAVFTQEIHTLEELGLVSVKYGSGAIMAGRTSPNQIYNVSLTDDGKDTARIILDRETRDRTDTARLEDGKPPELVDDDDDDELDETDQSPQEDSTKAEEETGKSQGLPGDHAAHDPESSASPAEEE
ncbi:MAG: hypothetical protein R3E76_11725 [Planctomycetota bacterium]